MGKDNADLVMEHLPPGGWTTLATKNDLLMAETRLTSRIDGLEHRIDGLEHRIDGLATRIDGLSSRIDVLDRHIKWFNSGVIAIGLVLFGCQVQIFLTLGRL